LLLLLLTLLLLLLFCLMQAAEIRTHFADQSSSPPLRFANSRATTFSCVDARSDGSLLVRGCFKSCYNMLYDRRYNIHLSMSDFSLLGWACRTAVLQRL
jgi:hypothetical protein